MPNPVDIVVVGSLNMDMIMQTPRMPEAGETLIQGRFSTAPGGKGANQAVAAAKLGAKVAMIGRVGADAFGNDLMSNLNQSHVVTEFIILDNSTSSGTALILVEPSGENRIVVASGANFNLCSRDIESNNKVLEAAKMVILQLETPLETVEFAAKVAHEAGVKVLLNPAPAQQLSKNLLKNIGILIPNLGEACTLTGNTPTDPIEDIAKNLHKLGPDVVIITLGSEGTFFSTDQEKAYLPPFKVNAVDTTAAGDAFIGGFSAALSEQMSIKEAVKWGAAAGALACTKLGAQPSLPSRKELLNFINS